MDHDGNASSGLPVNKENVRMQGTGSGGGDSESNARKGEKEKDSSNQLDELLDELESENSKSGSSQADTGKSRKKKDSSKKKTKTKTSKKSTAREIKLPKFPLPPSAGFGGDEETDHDTSATQESTEPGTTSSAYVSGISSENDRHDKQVKLSLPASSSAYGARPDRPAGGDANVCLDLSSQKFVPDDKRRAHIVLRKILGDPFDMPDFSRRDSKEGNKIIHDFPTVCSAEVTQVPLSRAPGSSLQVDAKQYIILAELASEPRKFHTIARKEYLPFIIIALHENSPPGTRWEFPRSELAKDFINFLLGILFSDDHAAAAAYQKTGKWGLLTLAFLASSNQNHLDDFRRAIQEHSYEGWHFDSYPKDALVSKSEISILLRSSMKGWKTEITPKVLFLRNKDSLAGTLRVESTTTFSAHETSHKGESKADWRKINLQGDDQLLRCLRKYPESHPFFLGVDAVQIRGGLRPPESAPTTLLGKRQWKPYGTNDPVQDQQNIMFFNPSEASHHPQFYPYGANNNNNNSSSEGTSPGRGRGSQPKRGRANRRARGRYLRK